MSFYNFIFSFIYIKMIFFLVFPFKTANPTFLKLFSQRSFFYCLTRVKKKKGGAGIFFSYSP